MILYKDQIVLVLAVYALVCGAKFAVYIESGPQVALNSVVLLFCLSTPPNEFNIRQWIVCRFAHLIQEELQKYCIKYLQSTKCT